MEKQGCKKSGYSEFYNKKITNAESALDIFLV
ncbi:zinc ribbon domain-containing protein [Planococcus glaciei]